jgi:hypothetical protein
MTSRHVRWTRTGFVGGGLAALAAAALVASCGGGGGSEPVSQAATIDTASASTAAANMALLVNICQQPAGSLSVAHSPLIGRALAGLDRHRLVRQGALPTARAQALSSTRPADTLGSCGGRYGYPSYSHTSGITTATLQFTDYCTLDSDTGHRQVMNGSVSFVNTATPTATGPITSKWEGDSTGVNVKAQKTDGTVVSSQTLGFSKVQYLVGVPGGSPTADKPDVLVASEFKLVDEVGKKTYLQSDYRLTTFDTASGGSQMSFSGRGHRSSGDYFDVTTSTPITMNSSGDYTGGAVSFTGAGGSTAVVTVVPGGTLQATLVVNGTPVTAVPACAK